MTLSIKMPRAIIAGLALLVVTPAFAQQPPGVDSGEMPAAKSSGKSSGSAVTPPSKLTKFDLDFPGGTPGELVAAIQKATGRPLNAIVPAKFTDVRLPAFKMSSVDVLQLFVAMREASHETKTLVESADGGGGFGGGGFGGGRRIYEVQSGFMTDDPRPSDTSVWYFNVHDEGALNNVSPTVCRFYLLTPYLQRGLTVDDITTAIQTGWKMLGDASPPAISFHKETNLLIAVGEEPKLRTIDAALRALDPPVPSGRRGSPSNNSPSPQP
jgi:hypothetical protein